MDLPDLYHGSAQHSSDDAFGFEFKIDFASKGLYDVQQLEPTRHSPWLQAGQKIRVLQGLAKTNRKRLKAWENGGFEPGAGPDGEEREEVEDEADDEVQVYYQIFVGPDQAAIRTFHSDRTRFHDLSTAGFPYLQSHLAFLDDLQYSGLWTITEIPSTKVEQYTAENMGTSSLLSSPATGPSPVDSGTPAPSHLSNGGTISPGRLSPFDPSHQQPEASTSTAPISLRTYWKQHVFPLRQDDLSNLGSKEVQFKLAESLGRDGRSLAKETGSKKTIKRPSGLSRDSTSDMIGDQDDDAEGQAGGRTPMNVKEDENGFPFGESEDADTPVNRSPPPEGDSGIRNHAFYIRAVEVLVELAELVQDLQERRLCIAICRPEVFAVQQRAGSKPKIALHTLSYLKPISRYDQARKSTQRVYEINLASAPAQVEKKRSAGELAYDEISVSDDTPIEQAYVESAGIVRRDAGFEKDIFDEHTMQENLAYIAPETVSEPDFAWGAADVYTWGSGAYDLLTEGVAEFATPTDETVDLLRDVHRHTTRKRQSLRSKVKDCPEMLSGMIERAMSLEPNNRYTGMPSLLADLREIHGILRDDAEREHFALGRVDNLSRFSPPTNLLERSDQVDLMRQSYEEAEADGICKVCCFYGESGTGKSKQVEEWLQDRIGERTAGRRDLLVGWAKMDQHQVRPLAGIVQVFEMLLSAIFSNPHENATVWKSMILDALPGLGSMFLDLLSPTWQDLLLGKRTEKDITAIDWETYSQRFKIWARNLFSLFASAQRPLVIVIDDWQWMESTERELWTELFEKKPLPYTLGLLTYRIEGSALDTSPLTAVKCIESLPFSLETIDALLVQVFHLPDDKPEDGFSVLASFLSTATKGNPLFITLLLARLVKDEVLYFDFKKEAWKVATEALPYYSTSGSIEKFARWTLSRLSSDVQAALRVLSCMPAAQGADLKLVARLLSRPVPAVRTSCEKAGVYGIVRLVGSNVTFTHDRHQEAARALIAEKDRSKFLAEMARKLEVEGPESVFIMADLLTEAMPIDPQEWSAGEISELMLDAAQRSIRSAAFEAAHRYVKAASTVLPVLDPSTWVKDRERCQRMCTLMTAIASGLRDTTLAFPAVEMAFDQGKDIADKIAAATMTVRLHLIEFHVQGVFEQADQVFSLLQSGLNIPRFISNPDLEWQQQSPQSAESLTQAVDLGAEVDDNDPVHAEAIALAIFMIGCGPTLYTRLPRHAERWFDFATAYILRSRRALMHPATGYVFGVRSILFASEPRYEVAIPYQELGLGIPWKHTSWQGSSEIPYKAIEYLRAGSISSINYRGTWNTAALSNATDILIYISAIELSALVLSGRSIPLIQERGLASLVQLKNDLAPVVRPFLSSFTQLAINLADTRREPADLWRLDGDAMSWTDSEAMDDHGALIGVSFWSTALLNAILFRGPATSVRDLANKAIKHREGWRGIIGHFKYLLVMSWCFLEYDFENEEVLREAHEAFAAFPLNVDFQGLRSGLFALQSLKSLRAKKISWSDALFHVESAVRTLSSTTCHLATGWLCLSAARSLRNGAGLSKRIWGGFVTDANQAFQRCGAVALGRQAMSEFPEAFNLAADPSAPPPYESQKASKSIAKPASPSTSSSDVASTSSDSKHAVFISEDPTPGLSQRLNIEGILKSFLAFATEKDSKMLLKRVLGILIQITRADNAFLALQNASTNKLHLRGGGSHASIQTYDLPVSDAASSCPAQVLLQVAHSRKSVDSNDSDQMPILRDGYFNPSTTKHILAVPLFIQNQFTGVICLQGSLLRFSSSVKSHVELLATFAAIVLESHDITASLEQSVRLRTTQLEQALTHRQTFISSITHELRTPLHSISGLTAIMENSSDLPEAQKENVAGIRSSAEDLQRIITDVLDLSKLENGSMQLETVSFDLRQVAEAALDSVANLAHTKDLEILLDNTVDADPLHNLLGDPFRIKQCLLNLLGNAIRFTEKGQIRLKWTLEPSPVGGETLIFSVSDTGIGIPVESRQRLFQPFSQVDASIQRKWGGTGLGLSITHNLAHIMKGSAWCESVEGKGSTFFFSLVVHFDKQLAVPTFKRENTTHVLLLCPPTMTTEKLIRNIQAMNGRTTISSPGNASDYLANVNAVVLDSAYSDAVPFVKRLSNEHPDVKVTFLAELTDKAALLDRLSDPNAKIITKPVKAEAIHDFLDLTTIRTSHSVIKKRIKPIAVIDKETASRHPLDILFVDDNPINRAVGLKVLKKFGYVYVDVATNGVEAVQAAENTRYDLILMDLQMPVMDGHTAMSKILASEKAGQPQVVALTANADTATRDLCLQQGFHGFLGKPLVIRELDTVFENAHMVKLNRAISR